MINILRSFLKWISNLFLYRLRISTTIYLVIIALIYGAGLGYAWRMHHDAPFKARIIELEQKVDLAEAQSNTYKMILDSRFTYVGKKGK